ncbi:hypothetical protein [Nocardia alba]|uniref:Uncharacterized protein n=1 Tax=Nocardia alba TaxID=225051 RepID=A0A4R1FX26_9NOCA|nr:hypothetical protein [Nocardia alba]TCJ99637.1 hypothetical protein DFR71_0619 [Nocardia alba]
MNAARNGHHYASAGSAVPATNPAAVLALRSIPVLGWLFLIVGVVRPFRARWLRVVFWIDAVLSVGVHAAQIPAARKVAAQRGISGRRAAVMTMLLGATWWKTLGEGRR